eukprot:4833306-Prymnesium_polylepis.1
MLLRHTSVSHRVGGDAPSTFVQYSCAQQDLRITPPFTRTRGLRSAFPSFAEPIRYVQELV